MAPTFLFCIPLIVAMAGGSRRQRINVSLTPEGNIIFTEDHFDEVGIFEHYKNVVGCRPMRCERSFDLANIWQGYQLEFVHYFREHGWESLANLGKDCIPDMVRYFYSNVLCFHDKELWMTVKCFGTEIKVTTQLIAEVIGVSEAQDGLIFPYIGTEETRPSMEEIIRMLCEPNAPLLDNKVPSAYITDNVSALNLIVSYTLDPHDHKGDLPRHRGEILYHIVNGDKINVPATILRTMIIEASHSRSTNALPFPLIIMKILKAKNVFIPSNALVMKPKGKFTTANVKSSITNKMKERAQKEAARHHVEDEDESDSDGPIAGLYVPDSTRTLTARQYNQSMKGLERYLKRKFSKLEELIKKALPGTSGAQNDEDDEN